MTPADMRASMLVLDINAYESLGQPGDVSPMDPRSGEITPAGYAMRRPGCGGESYFRPSARSTVGGASPQATR